MAIVGEHPLSGIRIVLERPRDGGPPWSYSGHVFTPTEAYGLRAEVAADGNVIVEVFASASASGGGRSAVAAVAAIADGMAAKGLGTGQRGDTGLGELGGLDGRDGQELEEIASKARLLLRTAVKSARASSDEAMASKDAGAEAVAAPPRRIVRWRGEK